MTSLDDEIMQWVVEHRTPTLTGFAEAVESAGESPQTLVLLAVAGLAVVVALKAWRVGAAATLALVVTGLVAHGLKGIIERPRPGAGFALVTSEGWAMPSTHAARASALSLAVLVAAGWSASGERRRWALTLAWGVVALNVALGVFMVYLGAHWPTDVLAGWALGLGAGWACGLALRRRRAPAEVRA